jgi:flagellar L-ring protein FlgH
VKREKNVKVILTFLLLLSLAAPVSAKSRASEQSSLSKYLAREQMLQPTGTASPGSIWVDSGMMASLGSDYKARNVGDLIEIVVVQGLTSSNNNQVGTSRSFNASSGITALPGKLKTAGVASLIGLNSSETLAGKGQASTVTNVSTNLSGRVAAVLASGNLVVEAERVIDMNHEKQTIVLRGVVRRGDIGPNNTVASDAVGDLELEIKGKGVISDSVRPPHPILRALLNILDF